MADSISAFFTSLLPDFRPKPQAAPTRLVSEARTVGGSSPAPKKPAASATTTTAGARPDAAPVQGSLRGESTSSSREDIRKQREKFMNDKFGNGKSKGSKSLKSTPATDNTPTSPEILAWN